MQTKGLIPFKFEICHPMAYLHFLRIPSKSSSSETFRDKEITMGHWSPFSKYAYFNYVGRGLRSSFRGSPFSLSFSVNSWRISSFFFQGQKAAHKSKSSSKFSSSSTNSSINSACDCSCSHYSSTIVSNKHNLLGLLPRGEHAFC